VDGKTLYRYGEQAIGGLAARDKWFFYTCLNEAAEEFVRETKALTKDLVLTTEEDRQEYALPPDFIGPAIRSMRRRFIGKYRAGDETFYPFLTSYEKIFWADETESKSPPERFAIRDQQAPESILGGSVESDGAAVGGSCVLHDLEADFTDSVYPRDVVHNVTDGSHGVVLEVVDGTHLATALFEGTDDCWSIGDEYRIIPGSNKTLVFDAPCDTAGHTLTLPYYCMPDPIYSDYGHWRFSPRSCRAICYRAAYLYALDLDFDVKKHQWLNAEFEQEVSRIKRERGLMSLQGGMYTRRG
jgi:hypothetical protein